MNPLYAILERFNEDLLQFPSYVAAFNDIEASLKLYRGCGLAQHLLVLGETGTGKTTLCRDFVTRYPRMRLSERDVLPVVHVSIPSAATVASVTEAMLDQLGDPSPSHGTVSVKTARAVQLAKAQSVELLLMDEAQHIPDRGKLPTQYLVGDWLKTIMDKLNIPTVLLGLPRAGHLLQVNEQVRRRFSRRRYLQMGQCGETSIEAECLQLFLSLGDSFPIPIRAGNFSWDEVAQRVYYASDGRVAYIKKLLAGAIRLALERELDYIGPNVLRDAFTEEVWWEGVDQLNPFSEKFQFRRLSRPGEPFEQALIGRAHVAERRLP
ncbi:TniB family NTP-binding protein [Ralstonia pseudosolanacearum]|uniref:TniB family NTP-binding protein n=1 Tax=Ralstonia pseudosolanacearum TaxID=1310165 RepID=UPI0026744324|nr:TniB family NTP-binding protein [Ralstonia pseudosolanacearum]MDO3506873.1 TniB family NTP-binding protein [Ralstonia pseudosolanacearum]MDO3512917.1 TniB family NTP-binding protein [Ralstonia pseudosolanacearum]MDO3536298.1 TniB family NTP-binding protein [Ralstonia pseudosolanacearum]MDO3606773.1 TniB family NTP-binding protein [Ralstonia pseudosolanacearum]MDO3613392.1 TniB family NTP-binding protein [Ralstonia pseudosolanacearum]